MGNGDFLHPPVETLRISDKPPAPLLSSTRTRTRIRKKCVGPRSYLDPPVRHMAFRSTTTGLTPRTTKNETLRTRAKMHLCNYIFIYLYLYIGNSPTAPAGRYGDATPIMPNGIMWSCPGRTARQVSVLGFLPRETVTRPAPGR